MRNILIISAIAVVSYMIGSINFSIILSKLIHGTDIRQKGSGNAGTTNMLRNFGLMQGIIVLFADFLKGFAAIFIAKLMLRDTDISQFVAVFSGLFCIIGHCFPIFFKFKGGKGVAVGAMLLLMTNYQIFIIAITLFILTVALSRFISLGSIAASVAFPTCMVFYIDFDNPYAAYTMFCAIFVGFLVIFMHRNNIYRLCKGTENKFSFSKKKGDF